MERNKINLKTESYLINGKEDERIFPFFELEFDEWVVFEHDKPKYYFRLNPDTESEFDIINWLVAEINNGKDLRSLISEIGRRNEKIWDIYPSQLGKEVENSYQTEKIELEYLTDRTIRK